MDKCAENANVMYKALKWIVENQCAHPSNVLWVVKDAIDIVEGNNGTTD